MASTGMAFLETVGEVVACSQTEIAVIVLAACAHTLIFSGKRFPRPLSRNTGVQVPPGAAATAAGGGRHAAGLEKKKLPVSTSPNQEVTPAFQKLKLALEQLGHIAGEAPPTLKQQALLQELVRLALAMPQGSVTGSRGDGLSVLLEELQRSGLATGGSCIYNSMLDACIECKSLPAAEKVMAAAAAAGRADVVTYNTMIKARVWAGDLRGARLILEDMKKASVRPTHVTFNELIDASIANGDAESAWRLVREMREHGLRPNHITCSILLKSVQADSKASHLDRTLAVVDAIDEEMDEVLLSSVLEACIRTSRVDQLRQILRRHLHEAKVVVTGAPTYGSIIRAYGSLKDIQGVRSTFAEMLSRQVLPTSITLGCTVEALAMNGDPDGGHDLIRQVMANPQTHKLVNAVIYCSVLKGFSHQKRFDRCWGVYKEMIAGNLQAQFTSVTYNTLIDACARCGEIGRATSILEDMIRNGVQPNLVTYSAVLKGYCQENRLDKAFELLDNMKSSPHVQPDELVYNTLLDGCARQNLYERGMQVFADMQAAGVAPSNFTLSVLVKLANRGKRLEEAFELSSTISKRHRFQLNVHVYNNLVQACIAHKDLKRALDVAQEMVMKKVRPDARSYSLLLRAFAGAGDVDTTEGLLRAAFGLKGAHPSMASSTARPSHQIPSDVVEDVLQDLGHRCSNERMVQLLSELRCIQGLRLDSKLVMRLTTRAMHDVPPKRSERERAAKRG